MNSLSDFSKIQKKVLLECPSCEASGKKISTKTMIHHIQSPWKYDLTDSDWYFCAQADCSTVYFHADGTLLSTKQLRTPVSYKETSPERTLCYCYGVKEKDVLEEISQTGSSSIRKFIQEQTKKGHCNCEITNPSGQCCLATIPRDSK